jgi:hypothetical protein
LDSTILYGKNEHCDNNNILKHVDGQMLLANIIGLSTTRQEYIGDSLAFIKWCMQNEPSWVAAHWHSFALTGTTGRKL